MRSPSSVRPVLRLPARQRGQALIYGIFVLLAGLAALYFLFNSGQLSSEKTKLVNTTDAVAYSAGILHARALNFNAYTNRALMANEAMIAQMVSLSSWIDYAKGHVDGVPPLACYTVYSVPVAMALTEYAPLCYALSYQPAAVAIEKVKTVFDKVAPVTILAAEAAKLELQAAQVAMAADLIAERGKILQRVADENYLNDGKVEVDPLPLRDTLLLFDGKAPFLTYYKDGERTRFKEAELAAARLDPFVAGRAWDSHSPWKCWLGLPPRGDAERSGSTTLVGFDEWKAQDKAALRTEVFKVGLFSAGCDDLTHYALGNGSRSANKNPSGSDWKYSGVPNYFELSAAALAYGPDNADPAKRDARRTLSIRLTRDKKQANTSAGRSPVKPGGRIDVFKGDEVKDVMAAVSTSEVFFERPQPRADGKKELASLFNPYWQVHLVANPPAVLAAALALQGLAP